MFFVFKCHIYRHSIKRLEVSSRDSHTSADLHAASCCDWLERRDGLEQAAGNTCAALLTLCIAQTLLVGPLKPHHTPFGGSRIWLPAGARACIKNYLWLDMIWHLIYMELVVYGKPLSFNGLYFDWVPQTVHERVHYHCDPHEALHSINAPDVKMLNLCTAFFKSVLIWTAILTAHWWPQWESNP